MSGGRPAECNSIRSLGRCYGIGFNSVQNIGVERLLAMPEAGRKVLLSMAKTGPLYLKPTSTPMHLRRSRPAQNNTLRSLELARMMGKLLARMTGDKVRVTQVGAGNNWRLERFTGTLWVRVQ